MTCQFGGPAMIYGDVEWVCRTHDDVLLEIREAILPLPKGESLGRKHFRCPVAEPRPGDSPLEREPR